MSAHVGLFCTYEYTKRHYLDTSQHQPVTAAACGVAGAVVHDFFLTPSDVVKQRLQLGAYKGPWDCVVSVIRMEGAGALYRSFPIALFQNAPYTGIVSRNQSQSVGVRL